MRFRTVLALLLPLVCCVFLALYASDVRSQQPQQPQVPAVLPPPPPAPRPASPQTPTIRQTVNLVNVLFTVLGRKDNLESSLERQDFQVFDDNKRQEIRFFSHQTDLPLRIGMLLDTSNSIRDRMQFEKDAAIDFLFKVIRKDKDEVFLMTVDGQPEVIQSSTSDFQRLRDVIVKQRAGGGTALYDAIYTACQQVLSAPPTPGTEARRILVVISDGDDNLSRHTLDEALDMAERADILVYTISTSTTALLADGEATGTRVYERKYAKEGGDLVLQKFADDSGGRAFFPYHAEDLAVSFAKIGDELRSQYSLAYALPQSAPDGKFHSIRITVNGKGMRVRARRGYYATAPAVTLSDDYTQPAR